jgi:hypothetical protein
MPSRAHLEIRAAAVGVDASTYPNDSKLEQKVIYEEKRVITQAADTAIGTLTSDATAPSNNDTVTIGSRVYTFKTALTEAKAVGTLTSDATNPSNNDTLVIGGRTYTFKSTLTGASDEIKIGADAATTLDNVKSAINATAGAGTAYGTGTVVNTQVSATTNTDTTQVLQALSVGNDGNTITTVETSSHLSFGGATLAGGVDPVAGEVLIGGSAAVALDNIKSAVNLTAGAGTAYSTNTSIHPNVTAGSNTNTTQAFSANSTGTAGNGIATTETSSHLSFGAATLTGGLDGTVGVSAGAAAAVSGGANV